MRAILRVWAVRHPLGKDFCLPHLRGAGRPHPLWRHGLAAPTCASDLGAPWPHYPMPPAAGLRITGRTEAPAAIQDRRWRLRSLRSAQGGPRQQQQRQQAATRASLQHYAGWRAAVPEKMHRDVLVAEAERSERAPTFKAHGAPPLARPSCRSAPPSRSRRRAPPHSCREGGDLSRGRLKGYQPRYPLFPYRSLILNPRFCLRKPSHVLMPRARMTNV